MCNSGTNCNTNEDTPDYCLVTEEGKCMSLFPKKNLITEFDNEKIYFDRMSDELIRYNRTKLFMFHPKTYMNISNMDFNIKEDELFLLESKLTREYFRDLVPYGSNSYVNYITYNNAQPDDYNKSVQTYSNKISIDEQSKLLDNTKQTDKKNKSLQDFIIDCIEHTKPNVTLAVTSIGFVEIEISDQRQRISFLTKQSIVLIFPSFIFSNKCIVRPLYLSKISRRHYGRDIQRVV